jgi:hypothetical protein
MEIKFIPIRIGKFRQNPFHEKILKENYLQLKSQLRNFVQTIPSETTIEVDIVIPAKGYRITITLDSIKDQEIKKQLIANFPDSIYKGKYETLMDNSSNLDFFPVGI